MYYRHNLNAFKELVDQYTIADLRSMIYFVPTSSSGACCYPAIQTLISLMEMLGKVIRHGVSDKESFTIVLRMMGGDYDDPILADRLYESFRHGIAHTSLAKSGVFVNKEGNSSFHLSNGKQWIDVKIFFEDFLLLFENIFNTTLLESNREVYYENNLRGIFRNLNITWLNHSMPALLSTTTVAGGTATMMSGASGVAGPVNFTPME